MGSVSSMQVENMLRLHISLRQPNGKITLWNFGLISEDNIKMDIRVIECGSINIMDLSFLGQDMDRWKFIVAMLMKIRV
jgi:hypothetical protein